VWRLTPTTHFFYEREGWADDGDSRASLLGPVELRYRSGLHES
jgi:hypothetical protein